jgi:hypothetical protein
MVDDATRVRNTGDGDKGASVARAHYERPVLKHLGSVNRLTLAISVGGATDGSKNAKGKT